jgi:hypothetical protein
MTNRTRRKSHPLERFFIPSLAAHPTKSETTASERKARNPAPLWHLEELTKTEKRISTGAVKIPNKNRNSPILSRVSGSALVTK